MSVISVFQATPNRIAIVHRFLRTQTKPLAEKVLLQLLSPPELQKKKADQVDQEDEPSTTLASSVLSECKALGLVVDAGDGEVCLAEDVPEDILSFLERRLLDPEEAKQYRQDSVPYAFAWFLCQHPATPLSLKENQKHRVERDTGGKTLDLSNLSRFQQFGYWVQYLGLGWRMSGPGGLRLVPDPTEALMRHLPAVLKDGEGAIHDVIADLGKRLPVLETGVVRTEVEAWLPKEKRRAPGDLSPSTSLALLRLQRRGVLVIEARSDAPMMRLLTWPNPTQASHLVWKGNGGGK